MNPNRSPESKRLKTDTNTDDKNANGTDDIAGSASGGSEGAISEKVVESFVNIFTDDILPQILDNLQILTVVDLLDFRLVNRCWRDAATSVLLKRNLCEIVLDFGKVTVDEDGNAVDFDEPCKSNLHRNIKNSSPLHKYFNFRDTTSFLSDLSALLSTSPKFPSTSIRMFSECARGFNNICSPSDLNDEDQNQKDLLKFLSLYGNKFKELSFGEGFPKKSVPILVYVYMPHLSYLNLREVSFKDDEELEDNEKPVFLPPPSTLELKEIVLGFRDDGNNFEKELIKASPNLSSIRSVSISNLEVLLELEKSHLIKDLFFSPTIYAMARIQRFSNLLADTILKSNLPSYRLSTLTIDFRYVCEHSDEYSVVVKVVNTILSAIKNSLKWLKIYMFPSECIANIFIPPLPYLKHLELVDSGTSGSLFKTKIYFIGDVVGQALRAGHTIPNPSSVRSSNNVLSLQNQMGINIPADYFPNLREVSLYIHEMKYSSHSLLGFFSIEKLGPRNMSTMASDTLLSVTTLDLHTFPEISPLDNINMSKLFPNVLNLKAYFTNSINLRNWVWTAFPKLENFLINGLRQGLLDTKAVDSFFTGISPELCEKFQRNSTCSEFCPEQAFERTRPYIGNCKNLKELTINFPEKLSSKFASTITASHGLKEVIPQTQIIFSFEYVNLSPGEAQSYFPIHKLKFYIRHEKHF